MALTTLTTTGPTIEVGGYDYWRAVAINAKAYLEKNPNDQAAQRALRVASQKQRDLLQERQLERAQASEQERKAAQPDFSGTGGAIRAAALNAGQGATFGFMDEILDLLPGVDSDEIRMALDAAREQRPVVSGAADIAGAVVVPAGSVLKPLQYAKNLAKPLTSARQLVGGRAVDLFRRGRTTRPLFALSEASYAAKEPGRRVVRELASDMGELGLVEGTLHGAGRAEGGLDERLEGAGVGGAVGLIGGYATPPVLTLLREIARFGITPAIRTWNAWRQLPVEDMLTGNISAKAADAGGKAGGKAATAATEGTGFAATADDAAAAATRAAPEPAPTIDPNQTDLFTEMDELAQLREGLKKLRPKLSDDAIEAAIERQQRLSPTAAPAEAAAPVEAAAATPARRATINLGTSGPRDVEFSDAIGKDLFSAIGRQRRSMTGKNPTPAAASGLDWEQLRLHLSRLAGRDLSHAETVTAAQRFRQEVMDAVRAAPAEGSVKAPSLVERLKDYLGSQGGFAVGRPPLSAQTSVRGIGETAAREAADAGKTLEDAILAAEARARELKLDVNAARERTIRSWNARSGYQGTIEAGGSAEDAANAAAQMAGGRMAAEEMAGGPLDALRRAASRGSLPRGR